MPHVEGGFSTQAGWDPYLNALYSIHWGDH